MSPAVEEIFNEWTLPLWLTLSVLITALLYVRGWLAIRKTRKEQFTDMHLLSFLAGLAVLWLAIGSPMDGFADALLSAHMVEHLLLMSVVPPLLLYGMPVVPLLRGLPRVAVKRIAGPLMKRRWVRAAGQLLVKPPVAWLLMNVSLLGWHVPAAYDYALEHENWHVVEHLCFLGTSLLFWWCVLRPWPARKEDQNWGILLYLVTADGVNTMLSAFLAFCGRPVYSYYLTHVNLFQVSQLDDQVLGAVVMWVFGSMVFLVPAGIITMRLAGMHAPRQRVRV